MGRQRRQNNVHHTRCGPHRHTRAAHAAVPSPNTHTSLFPHVCRRRPRIFSFVLLISRDLEAKVDEREAGHAHVHAHTTGFSRVALPSFCSEKETAAAAHAGKRVSI